MRAHVQTLLLALLCACVAHPVQPDTRAHLTPSAEASHPVAPPVVQLAPPTQSRPLPPPKAARFSIVAHGLDARELLFALARDAQINLDVHPAIAGTLTLNALDQTLPQLLERIAQQIEMRWEIRDGSLIVMPDIPELKLYKVDYLNMNRDANAIVAVSSELGGQTSLALASGGTGLAGGSNSSARIEDSARNRFWETLIQNLRELLRETDRSPEPPQPKAETPESAPANSVALALDKYLLDRCRKLFPKDVEAMQRCYAQTSQEALLVERSARQDAAANAPSRYREAASVIANPETGVISIRATSRQHEKVGDFLTRVQDSARRQVLIEATIAEVDLSENYQQGIDWARISLAGTGFTLAQSAQGNIAPPPSSLIQIGYTSSGGSFSGSIKLLESFGTVKVLSSPKISVLNNQTAVLKVVDNSVYFTIQTNVQRANSATQNDLTTYTTTVHTVPIGLVLSVTPQIGEGSAVILNVRPSLSRIVGQAVDPNPMLRPLGITNTIPVVRAREIESVLRIENGNIAIMGGLMEDAIDLSRDTVPLLSRLPLIGLLFQNRNDTRRKSELVILLRPTIVGQVAPRGTLPGADFFRTPGPLDAVNPSGSN
ncbi:pilus (MSHA type) biogenesis protein MshL [Niveibacterium terrae]|uniref:pilus (MSHA type) biogenesis protein MshL n=1 Tax=Niveibacterium terrae TaxID=3373598 RepID=UPI003A93E7AE